MIIEWKKDCLNGIPCIGKNGQQVSIVQLLPGMNDIPEEQWAAARVSAKDDIDRGLIVEHHAKVEEVTKKIPDPEDPKKQIDGEKEIKITATKFRKIPSKEAVEIVHNTFNMDTLKKWQKKEGREEVRAEIANQIDHILKYGEDRKKKLEDKD